MKKMKKVVAMLLALAMVLGMSLTVFAENPGADGIYGTADDRGKITVSGIEDPKATATAYQIVKANYENNGSFSGYEALYSALTDITSKEPVNKKITEAQLTAIVNTINDGGMVAGTSYPMTIVDGVATADSLPVGSYLVVISGAETKVYNPVVASIYYTNENGTGNGLNEAKFNIKEDAAWVKVSDTPHVTKNIIEEGELVKGNSANIGDTIDYVVGIEPIPNYGGDHPVLNIVDTLHKGLIFSGTAEENISVVVKDVVASDDVDSMAIGDKTLVYGVDYTATVNADKNEVKVDFVVNDKYMLNDYVGSRVEICYSAILTKDAEMNENANINEVVLNYSKDSKVDGNTGTDDDKVYSYTFDIDGAVSGSTTKKILTKTGEEIDMTTDADGDKGLAGAEFTLYTDKDCTQIYENRATGFIGSVESTESGQLPVYGLEAGTYYMKETVAPEGYSLNTHVFEIVITPTYDDEGKMTEWTIEIDGQATSTFSVNHGETVVVTPNVNETLIPNTKLTGLPSTGGIGTTIFTIGGCLIMIVAAGLFFASRKKSAK